MAAKAKLTAKALATPTVPLPGASFAAQSLSTVVIPAYTRLFRCHDVSRGALHFSTNFATNRFDTPNYGACYVGMSVEASFAECFCRDPGVGIVHLHDLQKRAFTQLLPKRDLTVAQLDGAGLVHMGATAAVAAGPYAYSKPWGAAIWAHPDKVDGILYASRHDNNQKCLVLFQDRCGTEIIVHPWLRSLVDDAPLLGRLLDHYLLGLDAP